MELALLFDKISLFRFALTCKFYRFSFLLKLFRESDDDSEIIHRRAEWANNNHMGGGNFCENVTWQS